MKNKWMYMLAFGVLLLVVACAKMGGEKTPVPAQMPAEYFGVYEGLLPAADGPGIQTTLALNQDGTFDLRSVYVGEPDGAFNEHGTFAVDGDIVTLELEDFPAYYQLGKGEARLLDMNKQPVTGEMGDLYVLMQTKNR